MSEATNETSEPSTGLGLFAGSSTDFVTRIKQKKPIAVRFRGIQVTDFVPPMAGDRSDSLKSTQTADTGNSLAESIYYGKEHKSTPT